MTDLSRNALKEAVMAPFWLDDPGRPEPLPCLCEKTTADLLIVGGGFTGLWAAVQAKEQTPSRDVVMIEANTVASGASGRPGAIVSTSVMHGLSNAKRIFPDDLQVLEQLGQENMRGFRAALERYEIDAHDEWNGELMAAISKADLPLLDAEFKLCREYGHDTSYLDGEQTRAEIASPCFQGAVWNRSLSGTLHPARLAWGLEKAALQLGVRIFENTPLKRIDHDSSGIRAVTPAGGIKAGKALLATNAFAAGHRKIRTRVANIRDRVIATQPLSGEQLDRIGWRNRQGVYDTRIQLNYMRLTRDNRIVFGGKIGYFMGRGTADPAMDSRPAVYESLVDAFFRTFPQLDDVKISHAWSGPIALTTRMAVHFQHYFDNKAIWVGGYSGFGVSASRFGARTALRLLDDMRTPELDLEFARSMPARIPPEPLRWLGAALTVYALDTAEEKGGWRHHWLALIKKMGFPL